MLVKFSTLAGGVYIEQRDEDSYKEDTRCFRFDRGVEYAFYGDLACGNPSPRWYGHCYAEKDFILA